jgi:hypothetical protein
MKQTAMQELRSMLIEESERYRKSDMRGEFVVATKILIKIENELLEKEKEQIIDAHIEGQRVFDNYQHTQWTTDQAEQYYKETFKQ